MKKEDINKIIDIFSKQYKGAKCSLHFKSPFELLVSTILSAQCTDARVNIVTASLYKELNTPYDFAKLQYDELGEKIKSCGFYKNKSKNIIEASKKIVNDFNGNVPDNMDDLLKLPGVGRKTASVVLANAYNVPAVPVDTHVFRVSNRIGLADGKTPEKVEEDLKKNIPMNMWNPMHNYLISHGRKVCTSRKPDCSNCNIAEYCRYFKEMKK